MPEMGGTYGQTTLKDIGSFGRPAITVVASATTIAPQSRFVRITGNTNIVNITPPNAWFNGPIFFFNTDASPGATTAAGNIALATTFVRYKLLMMIYDPATSKWYPTY